jgi:hypothetical protein
MLENITIDWIETSFTEALVEDFPRRYVLNGKFRCIKKKATIVIFAASKKQIRD